MRAARGRFTFLAGVFVAALSLAGCMATERTVSSDVRTSDAWAAVVLFDSMGTKSLSDASTRSARAKSLDVLALSGGGADGAFGAGVLYEWSKLGSRPKFDIVTGVSTGALQSTFAFLGPSYDDTLKALYTCTCSRDLFAHRGVSGLLGDSLMDTEPLKAKIASIVTDEVLERVAAEHRAGRRLYVATTNLDAGVVTVWDMGKLAASDAPGKAELYREILRASAAVPAYFKPVMLHPVLEKPEETQMHVDGGLKAPMLLRGFMVSGPERNKNVYVLVNGALRLRASDSAVAASTLDIAKKSISEMLRGLLYKTVYQSYVVVRNSHAKFKLGYVPDSVPETKNPLEFDPVEMRALFDAGREAVRAPDFWKSEPPRLEKSERVASARP